MYWCWRLLPSVVLLVALLLGVSDASAKRPVQRPPCGARLADHTAFVEAAGRYAGKFPRPPVPRSFADTAKRSKRFEDDFLRKLPALAPKSPQIARFECLSTFGARVAFATSDRRVRRATKRLETALAPPRTLSQIEIALRQAARDPVIVGVPGGRFGIRVARNLASGGRAVYEPDFLLTSTRTALRSRGVILTPIKWARIINRLKTPARKAAMSLLKLDALGASAGAMWTAFRSRRCKKGQDPGCEADLFAGALSKAMQFSLFVAVAYVDDLYGKARELAKPPKH
jgi:hypothetical protein